MNFKEDIMGELLNLFGKALLKGLEKGFEALDESYLYGEGLDEKKELFDTLLEKWKVFFNNPDLMGIIDREEKGYINASMWRGNLEKGEMYKVDAQLYLCKHNSGEFYYSHYDKKNIYFEFTKEDIILSFAMYHEEGNGLKLLLTFQPNGEKAESASIYYTTPPNSMYPHRWTHGSVESMLRKMHLDDMCDKIYAFSEHFESSDSFTEKLKAEIQEERDEQKRKEEEKRREEEHEEQERQRAIEEEKRKQEEKMDRLKNL